MLDHNFFATGILELNKICDHLSLFYYNDMFEGRACSPFSDFDVFRYCHNNQQRNLSNIFKPSIISNFSKKLSNISDAHPFHDKAITKWGVWFWYDYNNQPLARKNKNKLTCCSAAATWKIYKFLICHQKSEKISICLE